MLLLLNCISLGKSLNLSELQFNYFFKSLWQGVPQDSLEAQIIQVKYLHTPRNSFDAQKCSYCCYCQKNAVKDFTVYAICNGKLSCRSLRIMVVKEAGECLFLVLKYRSSPAGATSVLVLKSGGGR